VNRDNDLLRWAEAEDERTFAEKAVDVACIVVAWVALFVVGVMAMHLG
jgi:hypothetical protein